MPDLPPTITQLLGGGAKRKTARQRGYSHKWDEYSKWYLQQPGNHFCRICFAKGKKVLARCVDHIIDATIRPDLFWEPTNHQPLCVACNTEKSHPNRRW